MSGRILLATVAALALTAPAMAQDKAMPSDSAHGASPSVEQPKTKMQQGGAAAEKMTEQAPTKPSAEAPAQPPAQEQAQEPAQPPAEQPAMATKPPAEGSDQTAAKETPPADMKFIKVQEDQQFLANDEVIGTSVVNDSGEEVGSIADLVMDQDQKLVGVVLSVGGFLGVGDKWVAVPVEQIAFASADQPARLKVEVTPEQLENAPDFVTKETAQSEEAASQAQQQTGQMPAPAGTTQ